MIVIHGREAMTEGVAILLPTVNPSLTRIGWVGAGVMGSPMCGHLRTAGYRVAVYSRTKAKAQSLLDKGALWADSLRILAQQADVIFTMVGFPQDVRAVYFGSEGLLAGARPGAVLIDMTTSEPALAKEIYASAKTVGIHALDAPVSGGDVGAKNATLSIMVGGDKEVLQAVMPFLQLMGKTTLHQGGSGAGQQTKLCNQIVIAGTMVGVCESLLYGYKAGLDLNQLLESIRGGAAACWTLDNLAPRILQRNFDPGFFVDHFVKDMAIALEESKRMNVTLPGLTLVHQLYRSVQAQGHGRCGTHALMLALEELSQTQVHPFGPRGACSAG